MIENIQTLDLAPPAQASVVLESTWLDLPRKDLTTIPSTTTLPGNQTSTLKRDVSVVIDWTKDGVVINSELFDEDGYGRTYNEALEDFLVSLRDKCASLEKRETVLSPADRQVLDRLRDHLNFGQ